MKFLIIVVVVLVQQATGVIYRLNATEYARLPALFSLDHYNPCLLAPGDTYCYLDAKLVANETSELLHLIQEYSAYNKTHFDHTMVHRGLCMQETCTEFFNNSMNVDEAIEACLNATLYKSHGLQTRVINESVLCTKYEDSMQLDTADYAVAVVFLVLMALNVIGSVYDWFFHAGSNATVARLLLCFSARRNWRRLRMPSGEGPEPRLQQLKCFTGFKTITTFFVIIGHSPLNCLQGTSTPEYIDYISYNYFMTSLYSGTLIIQTFFIISGFLLAYNVLIMGEKRRIGVGLLPLGILFRWLRLIPVNAAVLAFVATWQRHIGSGPLWKAVVEVESLQCRRDWYYNVLFLNNYVDGSDCMAHTWYLGADMQLSVLGLMIFCLASSDKARKLCVALAAIVGLLTPAVHTYFQNLNSILIVSPEVIRGMFVHDRTFNNLYKRGHTNLISYALGLALAMAIYQLQKTCDTDKFKKYRLLYWATLPAGCLIILSCSFLYFDGIEVPLAARALHASAVKFVFTIIATVAIGGTILKLDMLFGGGTFQLNCSRFDDGISFVFPLMKWGIPPIVSAVYRSVLEWPGWAPLSRLAYSAYVVHLCVIRITIGAYHSMTYNSFYFIITTFLSTLCLSFLVALPLWMMIEAPFDRLVKISHTKPEHTNLQKNLTVSMASKPSLVESKETIEIKL